MFGFLKSIVGGFIVAVGLTSTLQADVEAASYQDTVCGPRCVKFLFHWYLQTDVPLMDIVHEIQWPGVANGTSFAAIKTALAARGIASSGAAVEDFKNVTIEYPIIAFLPDLDATKLGHYVVLLPGRSKESVRRWDGLSGTQTSTIKELSELQC